MSSPLSESMLFSASVSVSLLGLALVLALISTAFQGAVVGAPWAYWVNLAASGLRVSRPAL